MIQFRFQNQFSKLYTQIHLSLKSAFFQEEIILTLGREINVFHVVELVLFLKCRNSLWAYLYGNVWIDQRVN